MDTTYATLVGTIIVSYLLSVVLHKKDEVRAPVIGHLSWLEPTFLLRFRFCKNASSLIVQGYNQFRTSMFKLLRNDTDILVISHKYVDELRSVPESKLSITHAIYRNLLGEYAMLQPTLRSNIMTRAILTKLTPALPSFVPIIQKELEYGASVQIPECKNEWKEVDLREIVLRIVAHISARIIVGPDLCRDEAWLEASIKYTENAVGTIIILRLFPAFLYPVVYPLLPTTWKAKHYVRESRRMIIPLVEQRRKEQIEQATGYVKPNDFLQWMMDLANTDDERDPVNLAHRELLISQGSLHSTAMAAAHTLYDLCAHPEYIDPIRQEAIETIKEDGVLEQKTLQRMRKLDSFMKESQRMSPPQMLSFQRYARESMTLSDGVHIPKGTQFCVASIAMTQDPQLVSHPDRFDGWRYYNKRLNPAEGNRHQFTGVDRDYLHFGYGNHACPGRFFAGNEIKMIVIHFLLNYDLKFRPGEGRPKNMTHDELIFPDPAARMLIRRKEA